MAVILNMDKSLSHLFIWLERLLQVSYNDLNYELMSPIFTGLVLRGDQESHLRIRQLVAEAPWLGKVQEYVSKIVQLCVIPPLIVSLFTCCPDATFRKNSLKFLEHHLNLPVDRIVRLNDISRLLHNFIQQLDHNFNSVHEGLTWLALLSSDRRKQPKEPAQLVESFLSDHLCGILAHFDSILLNDSISLDERVQALGSITQLINLLPARVVSRMRAKFLTTMKCFHFSLRKNHMPFELII
ncbi:hypothetical protein Ciccas_006149 [Cichlidogyrus casuarinus]|uniref:UME domain-containing protein n=1 Tax=Cichlidogyrus casuarinus TaxID=1844966 RepID=A0ABD2Q929_9PLAT